MDGAPHQTVRLSRTLRTTRIGFLVHPADKRSVRLAMSLASSFWGGVHCPLIPVMRRVPRWWPTDASGFQPTSLDILNGYLDAFDPDWLISLVPGSEPSGYEDRLLRLTSEDVEGAEPYRPVTELQAAIRHLYETRFRFAELAPPEHVFHAPAESAALGDALLGCFSEHPVSARAEHALQAFLGAKPRRLGSDLLIRSQVDLENESPVTTPLSLGSDRHGQRRSVDMWHGAFLCTGSVWDAVEFWNLRAAGLHLFACPVNRFNSSVSYLLEHLLSASNSVFAATAMNTKAHARAKGIAMVLERPLVPAPQYWKEPTAPIRSPSLNFQIGEFPLERDSVVQVPFLDPDWTSDEWPLHLGAWVNEIAFVGDFMGGESASVIPADLRTTELFAPYHLGPRSRLRSGTVVSVAHVPGTTLSLRIPSGSELFRAWLAERGIKSRVSDPGHIMTQILRRTGGLGFVRQVLRPNTVSLLDRGTRRHHLKAQDVERSLKGDAGTAWQSALRHLVRADVLRAGMLLRCSNCSQVNWIAPSAVAEKMSCERCLEEMPFPHDKPPRSWAYRPLGPFAIPQFASGSYAAILAAKALSPEQAGATWVPSMELEGVGELDFALWRRADSPFQWWSPPEIILGEAKSYDEFKAADIDRMLDVRRKLGTGFLCFATLRSRLTKRERIMLLELCGRFAQRRVAPVIVLTSAELWKGPLDEQLTAQLRLGEGHRLNGADLSCQTIAFATFALHLVPTRIRRRLGAALRRMPRDPFALDVALGH